MMSDNGMEFRFRDDSEQGTIRFLNDGKVVVTLRRGGAVVELAEDVTFDDATRFFWESVQRMMEMASVFVLSYESADSSPGAGEVIVGVFTTSFDAMNHGDKIKSFDRMFVREFKGTAVVGSWLKMRTASVWMMTAVLQPFVYYGENQ